MFDENIHYSIVWLYAEHLLKFLDITESMIYICFTMLSPNNIGKLQHFFADRPVKKAYVFGSYSRDEANENSDVDILVELDHSSPIGMQFFVYQIELEELLKMKVDLVSSEGLSQYVKPHVDKDKILIYERTA